MTEIDSIDPNIPLEPSQTGSNTPTRRPQSSSAWIHVKRLRNHSKTEEGSCLLFPIGKGCKLQHKQNLQHILKITTR